ncbi:MAG: GNAT family N-acetyltransferase [Bacteroidales bacterium]|nr:GNAT family N-acetyltransferase [Bacteroidales bacterium]
MKGFECGIQEMDGFIHGALDAFLKANPQFKLNLATDDERGIVAMFVISPGIFVDNDGEFQDIPYGKPWSYFDEDAQMQSGTMYPSLEIDYLAVRKDVRECGYGSRIIEELSLRAKKRNFFFLTVDAYHTKGYSAIPFYEKQGFFALQEYSEEFNTLRMARRV